MSKILRSLAACTFYVWGIESVACQEGLIQEIVGRQRVSLVLPDGTAITLQQDQKAQQPNHLLAAQSRPDQHNIIVSWVSSLYNGGVRGRSVLLAGLLGIRFWYYKEYLYHVRIGRLYNNKTLKDIIDGKDYDAKKEKIRDFVLTCRSSPVMLFDTIRFLLKQLYKERARLQRSSWYLQWMELPHTCCAWVPLASFAMKLLLPHPQSLREKMIQDLKMLEQLEALLWVVMREHRM